MLFRSPDADSQGTQTGATPQTTAAKPTVSTILINPCPRIWRTTWVGPDPKHPGKTKTEVTDFVERAGFLTCRAGSYIRFHKHYVWVVGKRRKRPPVRWVNAGGKVGFVLRHPNDAKGKPPLNLKYGVMIPPKKLGEPIQSIKIDPKKQVAVLESPPKKFAADPVARLQKVSAPEIQGHLLTGGTRRAAGAPVEIARPGIPYDYKTGQFIRPGATIGKMTLKPTPFGGLTVGKPTSSGSGGQRSNSGGTSARNGGGPSNSGGSRSYSGPSPSRGTEPVRSAPPPPEPRSAPAPAPEPSRRPP